MICLAAGAVASVLALQTFTLAWTHSIEKIRWEEDWRVEHGALVALAARIRGNGAGMETPPGAQWRDGVWHYRPALAPQPALHLTHSPYAGGYEICADGRCAPLAALLPGLAATAVIDITPCSP
ncbi:MAG: DUF1850 domain-containing protein [Rhodocyclaceae bacterium]|nr:DUF1850 domain-containing protein [Rhodocyclaceae bacterium]MBX3667395.1 DUF1850 domain-containing protein [Rhodocyclaceae bacterium]